MIAPLDERGETFMTVAEIAEVLKLNKQTVRNWIDRGELPAIHVGRRVRVKRSDFERLIEQGYTGPPSTSTAPETTAAGFWERAEIPVPSGGGVVPDP
jgi:excisionase family DNA binding protein